MRIAPNAETAHLVFMPNDNILVERDFTISHNGRSYEIKAKAAFVLAQNPNKGTILYDFAFKDNSFTIWQPDKICI
jgi:hypothetical protein